MSVSSDIRVRTKSGQWCPVDHHQNAAFQRLWQTERIATHTETIVYDQNGYHFTLSRHPNHHHVHGGICLTYMSGEDIGTHLPMLDWNAIEEFRWCDVIESLRWQPVTPLVKEAYARFIFGRMGRVEHGDSSLGSNSGGSAGNDETKTEILDFVDEQGQPAIMYRKHNNGGCIVYRRTEPEEHANMLHDHEIRVSDHFGYKQSYMAYYQRITDPLDFEVIV